MKQKIRDTYFNSDNKVISHGEAIDSLCSCKEADIVIKDSCQTYGGFEVKKTLLDEIPQK